MSKVNEKELQKLFNDLKENNNSSFETIYNIYNKLVYGISYSILKNSEDAMDATQSVFTKIFELDKQKLPSKNAVSWLYTVSKNTALLILRKKSNDKNLMDAYEIEDTNSEINNLMDIETYNRLISGLNNREKEIISLKILGNFSFKEIGELLSKPTSTIKWKYYKAINSLKLLLSNLGMFLLTFAISLKILFNKSREDNIAKDEQLLNTNIPFEDENSRNQGLESEDTKLDIHPAGQEDSQGDNNSLSEAEKNNEEENETFEHIETEVNTDFNYIGIGTLSISGIFLTLTIIFAIMNIKYKVKGKRK